MCCDMSRAAVVQRGIAERAKCTPADVYGQSCASDAMERRAPMLRSAGRPGDEVTT